MNAPPSLAASLPSTLIIIATLAALWERARRAAPPAASPARRILQYAAWMLLGSIALIKVGSIGWPATGVFFRGPGLTWIFQALTLGLVLEAGDLRALEARGAEYYMREPSSWSGGRRRALRTAGAVLLMLAWTIGLIRLTREHAAVPATDRLGLRAMSGFALPAFVALALALAALLEESLFRHYLFYRIAAWARLGPFPRLAPILLTSALWALCHYGSLEPFAVKLVQALVLGLILGALAWSDGLACAVLAHGIFNLALMLILPRLL